MTFKDFIGSGHTGVIGVFNDVVVPMIFTLAFLVFVYGMVKYFYFQGNEETKRAEGRQFALWGIIAFAVMFSVWGILNILLSTLGIAPTQ